MSGWFSVKRGITSHPLFKGHPERLAIWLWLLDNAAWKDTKHDVNGKTITVPRGSVCASTRRIADEVGVGHQVVRTFLDRLKDESRINTEVTHGRTLITLCNWDKYQSAEKPANTGGNTRLTQDQHTKETREQISPTEKVSPSSSVSPIVSPATPKPPKREKPKAERFDELWNDAYPHLERKIARGKCEAKYRQLVESGVPEDAIIGGARLYAKSKRVQNGAVCNPLTWLNQRRWEDEAADIIPFNAPNPHTSRPKGRTNGQQQGFLKAIQRRREAADALARGMDSWEGDDPAVPLLPAGR